LSVSCFAGWPFHNKFAALSIGHPLSDWPALVVLLATVASIPWTLWWANSTTLCLFILIIGAGAFMSLMVRQRLAHKRVLKTWAGKAARWANLFYCARCNSVSDLHTREWVPAVQTRRFWP
jgi:hypothetical protein